MGDGDGNLAVAQGAVGGVDAVSLVDQGAEFFPKLLQRFAGVAALIEEPAVGGDKVVFGVAEVPRKTNSTLRQE
ncbi:MAG: hypothetical protein R3F19_17975 [Verrucomicrobiales bacterium]